MPKIIRVTALLFAPLVLSGCSVFYPNWGATSLPEPSQTETQTQIEPQGESAETSETPAVDPSETATPEPSEEVAKRKEVSVDVIMAIPEPDFGVLTVVAQIPSLSESGGKCVFKFIGGDTEKTLEVNAEPSSDYTQCFPIEYPLGELPKGNGVVTVGYESDAHFGTSKPVAVVID